MNETHNKPAIDHVQNALKMSDLQVRESTWVTRVICNLSCEQTEIFEILQGLDMTYALHKGKKILFEESHDEVRVFDTNYEIPDNGVE